MSNKTKAVLLLLTASFIWGISFPMNRYALDRVDPVGYTALRYLFGSLAFLPLALRWGRRKAPAGYFTKTHKLSWIWGGVLAGFILTVGNGLQYYGLALTTASKAGFINSLYVTLVPIFGLILGIIPSRAVWVGIGISCFGLFLVSDPGSSVGFNRGDALVLVADLFWATHVFILGYFTVRVSSWLFIFSQTLFGCIFGFLLAEFTGTFPTWVQFAAIWPFAVYGILSVSGAYICQALAQKHTTPTSAALVMQSQSVIAAVAGVIFLNETMSKVMILGAFLLVSGTIFSQLSTDSAKLSPDHPHFKGWQTARVLAAFLVLAVCALAVLET
jgi:drug/metabolite transporter (DMT)-like permease